MLKIFTRNVADMISYVSFTKLVENLMKQLKFLKNTIVSTSRILISQWQSTLRVLDKLMMQLDITFKVRHIGLKYLECFVLSVFTIDCNHLSKLKKSLSSTDGGHSILKLRVLYKKHLGFTDLQMTMVQL